MLDYNTLYEKVKYHFLLYNKEERFNHTLGVIKMALYLNKIHNLNLNEEKIKISALIHDYSKVYSTEILKKYILKEYSNDLELLNFPEIFHALIGDVIVKQELDIIDLEILDAVKYHTTGKANMSSLTKLIYLSDYIEEGRKFNQARVIRELAYKSIDKAIFEMTKNTIEYLESKGFAVYSKTYETYNYYKEENLNA